MGPAQERRQRAQSRLRFDHAARIFLGPTVEFIDERFDYAEIRIVALGIVDGRCFVVVYTDRGDVRRIISARLATRRETKEWFESQQ